MLVLIKVAYHNIHTTINTEKARRPQKFCPRATCDKDNENTKEFAAHLVQQLGIDKSTTRY